MGLSGGLLTAWNPQVVRCMVFLSFAGIVVKARFKGSLVDWHCLNVYAPFSERDFFWKQFIAKGIFEVI